MTGIWLLPCNGIHTFGMRASIDVVVLDREYKVLRVIPALCPNRIVWPLRSGHSTLELAPGSFEAIAIMAGDILEVEGAHDV